MKLYSLNETPLKPVSHDPALKKKVIMGSGVLPCVRHVSHIVLETGSKAAVHEHENASEVFYCIRGKVRFRINGQDTLLSKDQLLIVESGDIHSIEETPEETELLYLMVEH